MVDGEDVDARVHRFDRLVGVALIATARHMTISERRHKVIEDAHQKPTRSSSV